MRRNTRTFGALFAACTALLVCSPARAAVTGACAALAETDYASSAANESTNSTTWVDLNDGGSISFATKKSGCVIVTLSAEAVAATDYMFLQAVLDGTMVCMPGTVVFLWEGTTDTTFATNTMTLVCDGVAKGNHTLQVQYESSLGNSVGFGPRTLTVAHN